MSTRVINTRRHKELHVYVGRPQKFGSPIVLGRECPECGEVHRDKASTIPCFRQYLRWRMRDDWRFAKAVRELKGETLGCFCVERPWWTDQGGEIVCHAQVLALVAEGEEP